MQGSTSLYLVNAEAVSSEGRRQAVVSNVPAMEYRSGEIGVTMNTDPTLPMVATIALSEWLWMQTKAAAAERIVTLARETMQHLPCSCAAEMRDAIDSYDAARLARLRDAGTVPAR